jgi:hypothetical protein
VQDRSARTLVGLIGEWCLPGTIIVSDGWAGYSGLEEAGFQHEVVVHEQHFVDPETGIHTNNVENFWQRCKRRLKWIYGTSRELLPSHVDNFLWIDRYGHTLDDRWKNFFVTIRANYLEIVN